MLNTVKEELLDYASFIDFVKNMISKKMGKGYNVEINKVANNNSPETDILTVLKEGRNFAPNIYLNAYYESYLAGTSMTDILERICMIYKYCAIPAIRDGSDYSFDTLKSHIFFRLINFKRNINLLKQIPYIKIWDLAVTFHCLVRDKDGRISTIRITNEHIKQWGVDVDELYKLAFTNTRRLFPPFLKSMKEVLKEYSCSDSKDNEDNESYPMFILTVEKGIYGAFYLLYKNVIRELARLLNSNLYILPSSIHELIIIPMDDSLDKKFLKRLIMELNESIMTEDEILSDNVYIYSLENDSITI